MSIPGKPHLNPRLTSPADMPVIAEWVKAHKGPEETPPAWLENALGIIIDDESGPACALFAMECFRVPFCYLDYPVSRPGMNRRESIDRFRLAVASLIQAAGKCCDPPATFTDFVCYASPGMAAILAGMGFEDWVGEPQYVMRFTLPPPPPTPVPSDSSAALCRS